MLIYKSPVDFFLGMSHFLIVCNKTRISSRLDRTARRRRVGGGDKKPRTDTQARPKKVSVRPLTQMAGQGW